jgi:hypothetical protein
MPHFHPESAVSISAIVGKLTIPTISQKRHILAEAAIKCRVSQLSLKSASNFGYSTYRVEGYGNCSSSFAGFIHIKNALLQ